MRAIQCKWFHPQPPHVYGEASASISQFIKDDADIGEGQGRSSCLGFPTRDGISDQRHTGSCQVRASAAHAARAAA